VGFLSFSLKLPLSVGNNEQLELLFQDETDDL
jgi:hypothetical protein